MSREAELELEAREAFDDAISGDYMMTEQDRYTELYETWCRVDLINLIIKLEAANRRQQ